MNRWTYESPQLQEVLPQLAWLTGTMVWREEVSNNADEDEAATYSDHVALCGVVSGWWKKRIKIQWRKAEAFYI